jgi:hypothetical protein
MIMDEFLQDTALSSFLRREAIWDSGDAPCTEGFASYKDGEPSLMFCTSWRESV